MSVSANAKHHAALFLISIGVLGLMVAGVVIAIGVQREEGRGGWFGCGAAMALPGLWLLRKGSRVRNKAVAAGSTVHLEGGSDVWTTRTGKGKLRFLKKKDEDEGE